MYYEKTILDSFELRKDFGWTLGHSGLDPKFYKILWLDPKFVNKVFFISRGLGLGRFPLHFQTP